MRTYDEIFDLAAERKGGAKALNAMLEDTHAKSTAEIAAIPDDRWLSDMTKRIFQAGFNWKVIESKWSGFEEAFWGFDLARCAMMSDDDLDALVRNTAIVRNPQKIKTVSENAVFLGDLAREHGSVGKAFAEWPSSDYAGLLMMLKKRGSRLGGNSAMYHLRFMGLQSWIFSNDMVAALIREGVIDKAPTSATALKKVQEAFNIWSEQSGRGLSQISRTLALSIGD
ncbi:MAG: DNA-3-methyladenine glycosylase I [Pseudomonadota bacterium]